MSDPIFVSIYELLVILPLFTAVFCQRRVRYIYIKKIKKAHTNASDFKVKKLYATFTAITKV